MEGARRLDAVPGQWSLEAPRMSVGYDGAPLAARAVAWAADHARRHAGSVTVVTAWPGVTPAWPETGDLRRGARVRAGIGARLIRLRAGPTVPVRVSTHPETASGALVAESDRSDLMVLGTRGSSGRHLALRDWLGPVARQVVEAARCPVVLVGRATPEGRARRCLLVRPCPVDESDRSLEWAVRWARSERLPLRVVTTWQLPFPLPGEDVADLRSHVLRRAAHEHQAAIRAARALVGPRVRGALCEGPVAEVLDGQVSETDLVVLPQRDLGDVETAVTKARGPVVIVPPVLRPASCDLGTEIGADRWSLAAEDLLRGTSSRPSSSSAETLVPAARCS